MNVLESDLLVIGGGINGVGVAADAAGRGLSVVLCEKDDLANHTSSYSSKLIHGGLRYLEQIEIKLVREALKEREILMKKAPYMVRPLEFVLPHDKHLRPAWMIRIGLFLYDYLARRESLKGAKKLNLRKVLEGKPLKEKFKTGFRYTDCQTDDARLVVINALDAQSHGAMILTRTDCQSVTREAGHWVAKLYCKNTNEQMTVHAKALVNATGPWVSEFLHDIANIKTTAQVRLIKGSHFTVPKLYKGHYAYILQNPDGRVVFAIPFKRDFTLIGTTDVPFDTDPNVVTISEAEINYLLDSVNYYFSTQLTERDINWSYAGVRSLYDDKAKKASQITRKYHLDVNEENGRSPIISIFGGKITTYRSLSEHVMSLLKKYFPNMGKPWTAHSPLPGSDLKGDNVNQFFETLKQEYPWVPIEMLSRYAESYGTITRTILKNAKSLNDLGQCFGADLYEAEVDYLIKNEWTQTCEDLIWRRSKLGLVLTDEEINRLKEYIASV
ncbi:glycerol-3-phosphate dehydrogenase [Candidiatus Paracoxiella cheracis]|uniref:glycerol-3-phosphate dehydrogenase n=1 Tax=Candidiatus Paracoxiella cheracis TaxID=3405120 RepID=UPI003BF4B6A0